jgi:hypothetical protein
MYIHVHVDHGIWRVFKEKFYVKVIIKVIINRWLNFIYIPPHILPKDISWVEINVVTYEILIIISKIIFWLILIDN